MTKPAVTLLLSPAPNMAGRTEVTTRLEPRTEAQAASVPGLGPGDT